MSADWDRLVDRATIAHEQVHIAERLSDVAMVNAEWLVQPRLKLLDESRRVVRVLFIHEIGVCFSAKGGDHPYSSPSQAYVSAWDGSEVNA